MTIVSRPIDIRFSDLDPYGHVNHSIFLTYFELGRSSFLKNSDNSLLKLAQDGIKLVVVDLAIKYRAGLTSSDSLRVESEIVDKKLSYIVWHQELLDDQQTYATAEVKVAALGPEGRPTRFPEGVIRDGVL